MGSSEGYIETMSDINDQADHTNETVPAAVGEPETPRPETGEPARPPGAVRAGVPWGMIFFLVLSVLMAVFAVQNTQDVQLEFLGWAGEFPLIMIVVGVFAVAVVLDEVLGTILRRRRRTRRREKQELKQYRKST